MDYTLVCDLCGKETIHVTDEGHGGGYSLPDGWVKVKTRFGTFELGPVCAEALRGLLVPAPGGQHG